MTRALTILGILALTVVVGAQDRPPVSFQQLTVTTTAAGLSSTTLQPSGGSAQYCVGLVETADIRIRADGTAPTTAIGALAQAGALVEIIGGDAVRQSSYIATSATASLGLTCFRSTPEGPWRGAVVITPPQPGVSTTGTGSEVHATAPSLTSATIAGGALSGTFTGDPVYTGDPLHSGRHLFRESFDQGYFIMQDDATPKSVTDNEMNVVFGSPIGIITYHEEVTKTASSWVIADGVLNISGDNDADNEGVEIRLGWNVTTEGWIVAQTSGACFTVNLTLGDISGTDQLLIGWVQNEAYSATNTYTAYSDWSLVGVNNVDGSIFSLAEVAGGGTLSDDSGVNMADGETRTLRSCVLANGTRTASYTAAGGSTFTAITLTNGVTAHTAGDQLLPMITFLSAGTDGADVTINWMEVSALP